MNADTRRGYGTLAPGTLVIIGRRLGRIAKQATLGGADGYSVQTITETHEGTAPHFAEAHAVQIAELGVNVCRTPRGGCYCGLVHIHRPEWLADTACSSGTPDRPATRLPLDQTPAPSQEAPRQTKSGPAGGRFPTSYSPARSDSQLLRIPALESSRGSDAPYQRRSPR